MMSDRTGRYVTGFIAILAKQVSHHRIFSVGQRTGRPFPQYESIIRYPRAREGYSA